MPSLKEVKERISSIQNTQQITNAMKLVSAAKLRRAQDAILQIRPYAEKMQEMLSNVVANIGDSTLQTVYNSPREIKHITLVAVTSDRGLCGGFNSNILKGALSLLEEQYPNHLKSRQFEIVSLGKKGFEAFGRKNFPVNGEFVATMNNLNFMKSRDAANYVIKLFTEGKTDKIVLVYNRFINVATQAVSFEDFLPLKPAEKLDNFSLSTDYIFEPSIEFIIEDLIPKSLKINFYKALLESNASEHGARMTSMDKATENAGELLKDLRLEFNRSRQAAITKELNEIVGGANAL